MEIKHQVFVSSTYRDLIEERKEVIHALLELDCIPAGMELFPATDEDAWSLITEVIDDCDYYILILAGKYGSTNQDGMGFTEMEFDYAMSQEKPIICFLFEDIEQLSACDIEKTDTGRERLDNFREKAKQKHCKFWGSAHDLGGKVSRSLIQLKKKHPSDGWVPGRYAANQEMLSEMEKLRSRIAELELSNISRDDLPPEDFNELRGGEDTLPIGWKLNIDDKGTKKEVSVPASWNQIFSYCGAALSGECTTEELREKIRLAYYHSIPENYSEFNQYSDIFMYHNVEDQVHIQLQALGLMAPGEKKRAVSDTNTYWKLTPFGEKHLIQVRALRR